MLSHDVMAGAGPVAGVEEGRVRRTDEGDVVYAADMQRVEVAGRRYGADEMGEGAEGQDGTVSRKKILGKGQDWRTERRSDVERESGRPWE